MKLPRVLVAGLILFVALALWPPAPVAHAATYTVTNTNDSGVGSLRWAINQANINGGADTIAFNIPGAGVHTIQPLTLLPWLIDGAGTTIDGYSQPGAVPATDVTPATILIELDGSLLTGDLANGLVIASDGNLVQGLAVNRFAWNGIVLAAYGGYTATNSVVAGNYIGTDPAGTTALGNTLDGVFIGLGANQNTVGGTTPAERNVISGNGEGVGIHGAGTDFNVVVGNYIGTNAAGTAALGNGLHGVRVYGGAQHTMVGIPASGGNNLISGNAADGVRIAGEGTDFNVVARNLVGVAVDGLSALPNGGSGVYITLGAEDNLVGGDKAVGANLISANLSDGVTISETGTMGNIVAGNLIGTDRWGTAGLGNGSDGVAIGGGAALNVVGGDSEQERNLISGNEYGVHIVGTGTISNAVSGNSIGTTVDGLGDLGNARFGVYLEGGAQGNRIGGDSAGERNVVSGNDACGVYLEHASTSGNVVSGNYIGVDVTGAAALGNGWDGVEMFGAAGNRIGGADPGEGNVISGNTESGVFVTGDTAAGNRISGNLIGTDATGSAGLGNLENGITLDMGAHDSVIGGTTPAERNIISGNGRNGVDITGSPANTVSGNYIGTDLAGTSVLTNSGDGIWVGGSADGNVVGGAAPGEGNLVSGNGDDGIALDGALNTTVQGNLIGTAANGTTALGNADFGVYIGGGSQGNVVGGTLAGQGNVVVASRWGGIYVAGSATAGNTIAGNAIGTDAGGTLDLGNGGSGIELDFGTHGNTVGPANLIAYNEWVGVLADAPDVIDNDITQNSIHTNSGMGIDLVDGAHGGILPPAITGATAGPGLLTVEGTACAGCTVEVFSNGDTDGEGEHYIGSAVADGGGAWTLVVGSLGEPYLTATATGAAEGTSEFSAVYSAPVRCTVYLPVVIRQAGGR